MNDIDTTEVKAEEKTFGTDARPALEAYKRAADEADRVYAAATGKLDGKLREVQRGIRELVDDYNTAVSINDLLESLTAAKRQAAHSQAQEVRKLANQAARDTLHAALGDDPFTKFVATHIRDNYGEDYAETFFQAMPLTFEGLKQLANRERWCTDYEEAMRTAVRHEALPADTVELRRRVAYYDVPDSFGAKEGETWERVAQVYAYARTVDSYRSQVSFYTLRHHIVGESDYVKVSDAPAETTSA